MWDVHPSTILETHHDCLLEVLTQFSFLLLLAIDLQLQPLCWTGPFSWKVAICYFMSDLVAFATFIFYV